MVNRPLYIRKYHSSRLKEFHYRIENTFDESKELKEITSLADNQILRTIRDVSKRTLNREKLEILIQTRDLYRRQLTWQQNKHNRSAPAIRERLLHMKIDSPLKHRLYNKYADITVNRTEAGRIQDKINRTLFQEDYVTVVMDTPAQYDYLFHNGFYLNGRHYRRLSCSAGQARVSTVVFGNEDILPEVKKRLNNGRNESKKFSPSKFNAYFGLAGSATKIVSEPKFIVVKDFINTDTFMANFVIENSRRTDDTIVQKEIKDTPMNRTDGMGLISYRQAEKWADELGLDYVPSQFCIRQNFIKGMLCVFPIHEFCEEVNGGNYLVDTIYTDAEGNSIKADLREYDVIITESQFKLWDSFDSIDTYIQNYRKNKLYWGVSLTSPKEAKRMLKLNYQFIQTLNLNQNDIEELSCQFVDWINGVSYDNIYYTLLFLLGVNNDREKVENFLSGSDNYWVKSLIANHSVRNDRYIRTKIRDLIKKKIDNACKGDIYVDGNFQVIVSDPYGFMQHVCGLPVTGLLKKGEFYSSYWNERNVTEVDAMRSPLTYLSEHVILHLRSDEETNKWYRYCKLGIILNYHGHETFHFAGSDFDFDILATTSNKTMIRGVYKDELPVVYDAPKPLKINFTEEDLYKSDTFSFGSIIGSITNKSSNGYALLPLLKKQYGEDSAEYRLVKSRLQQCCKAQSAQIDKAKIGKTVKGIPDVWTNYNKIHKNKQGQVKDKHARRKELYNRTLLTRYPYFFRYVYKDTNRKYKQYVDEYNTTCLQKYKMPFSDLEKLSALSDEQMNFIQNFYHYSPVVWSESSMNLLCKYIEGIHFNLTSKTKITTEKEIYELYKSDTPYLPYYKEVVSILKEFLKKKRNDFVLAPENEENDLEYNDDTHMEFQTDASALFEKISAVCPNPYTALNCLVDYYYVENPKANKDLLWSSYGKFLYKNIIRNTGNTTVWFPFPDEDGDIEYLGYKYKLQEVRLS